MHKIKFQNKGLLITMTKTKSLLLGNKDSNDQLCTCRPFELEGISKQRNNGVFALRVALCAGAQRAVIARDSLRGRKGGGERPQPGVAAPCVSAWVTVCNNVFIKI